MADLVDEIKNRLGVVEVVSQYVQLKKAGRSYKACCPFHSEKSPSFVVSPEKQIWHCFGCNKGGDLFSFVQEFESIGFTEALELMAERCGLKVEDYRKTTKRVNKSEKDEFYNCHELASQLFEEQLHNTNDGKKVLEYLDKRGVNLDTVKDFRLGFSPDEYDFLYPKLLKKGISKNVLIKSGLVSAKNLAADSVYDKFRGRLIFPIFDYLGKICGFGGRALKSGQMPKYLNSPENVIYNKSKVLYGFSHAKGKIKEKDQIILVEGYFDVILPFQEGVENIVATSGTALTPGHVKLIKRLTKNVITCFDADSAGFEATKRAYNLMSDSDLKVKSVGNLEGKDPADFVLNDLDAFQKEVDSASDFIDYYISRLISENNIDDFEGQMKVVDELLPIFKKLGSIQKDHYIRNLSNRLGMKEASLYDAVEKFEVIGTYYEEQRNPDVQAKKHTLAEIICGICLEYPSKFEICLERLEPNDFSDDIKRVYNTMFEQYNSARQDFSGWDFSAKEFANSKSVINVLQIYTESNYGEFSQDNLDKELENLIRRLKSENRERKLRNLQLEIQESEKSGDKEKLIELLKKQQKILSETN